jgi:hypothetical protein
MVAQKPGDLAYHMPGHLRVEPAHPIRSYRKICRMKRMRLHEFQDSPISDRPAAAPLNQKRAQATPLLYV